MISVAVPALESRQKTNVRNREGRIRVHDTKKLEVSNNRSGVFLELVRSADLEVRLGRLHSAPREDGVV